MGQLLQENEFSMKSFQVGQCWFLSVILKSNVKSSTPIRVSVQGVESLWGDCRFIPADWGSQ